MAKLKQGDKLWIVVINYRGVSEEPKEVTVGKVGNKYFEIDGIYRSRFEIETLREYGSGNYKAQCYLTLQEILDERECSKLNSEMRELFSVYGNTKLSLEQLRSINEIVNYKK